MRSYPIHQHHLHPHKLLLLHLLLYSMMPRQFHMRTRQTTAMTMYSQGWTSNTLMMRYPIAPQAAQHYSELLLRLHLQQLKLKPISGSVEHADTMQHTPQKNPELTCDVYPQCEHNR